MRLCIISNTASHYRTSIYKLIDEKYETEFYFSEPFEDIKRMDYAILKRHVKELKTIHFQKFSYQRGVLSLINDKYDKYITLGDVRSISTWLFLLKAKILKKPVYVWTHGWYGKESKLETFIKKVFYKLPSGVLLYGNYAKRLMEMNGVNPFKLSVVHNSLNYSEQLLLRNNMQPSDIYRNYFLNDSQTIIFIGRVNNRKRLDLLINALYDLHSRGHKYNLVIVGDGPEKANLQGRVEEKGLKDYVWFYGACYDERRNAELIYNADLCVTPGDIGLTAIHVLMFGVPVITHNNYSCQGPEFEAICEGVTGTFYEYGSVESLSNSIFLWLNAHVANREDVRLECYKEIDLQWTPYFQLQVIQSALGK